MPRNARFVALLPAVVLDILLLDTIQNQFDRYQSAGDIDATCARSGSTPCTTSTGSSRPARPDPGRRTDGSGARRASRTRSSGRIYPQGAFLGIDMGVARARDRA